MDAAEAIKRALPPLQTVEGLRPNEMQAMQQVERLARLHHGTRRIGKRR